MEVVVPVSATEFNFDSACSSPYISAPSSPKRFGGDFRYFSAPTSPSRAAGIYHDFNRLSLDEDPGSSSSSSRVPFRWEEKPGTPKSPEAAATRGDGHDHEEEEDDFAFDFSGQLDPSYLTAAEELFEEGKIRPLKPPPRLQVEELPSPRSPKSPKSPKRMFREAFSPRAKKDVDPFEAAIEKARKGSVRERGRERAPPSDRQGPARRATRSLSPFRISDILWTDTEPDHSAKPSSSKTNSTSSTSSSSSSSTFSWSFRTGAMKWKLKDFLLFRSASEGRATTGKDPLRKYSPLAKAKADDVRNSSFRSTESSVSGSVSGSQRGRKGPTSAHELHYTANRAVSEELRKKTFLPYRQGLLGCLGFNSTVHGLAQGFHSVTRNS